jgi:hypothetical protein
MINHNLINPLILISCELHSCYFLGKVELDSLEEIDNLKDIHDVIIAKQ